MHRTAVSPRLRLLQQIAVWLCLGALLAACEIEGGVPSGPDAPPTLGPPPTSAAVAQAIKERADTWSVGLLDAPADLYPYAQDASGQRAAAPITELLFPAPILAFNYGYTSTGVLERIPSLQNGDVEIRSADVYLDAAGNITTTVTDVITQVQQLAVSFRWNPRLRWSDGRPVTADDSVFAYELAKAAPPSNEARDRLIQTMSYEKVDEHTTRAVLRPDFTGPTFFLNYWTPLPRHLLAGVAPDKVRESDFARAPVGYGPYAIKERSATEIRMVRSQHYFGPAPAASNLLFTFFSDVDMLRAAVLNGNLDVAVSDRIQPDQFVPLEQDVGAGRVQAIYQANPIWEHIDFNLDVPQLQDIRVRRAIAHGTNRQAMADALFQGRTPVLDSWVLPAQAESAPPEELTRYEYNPDTARALLDELGYSDPDGDGLRASPDGVTLTLTLTFSESRSNPVPQEIARRFQADMRAIGINIDLLPLKASEFFDTGGPLFQRQFELALFAWAASPDPGGLLLWSCQYIPSEENSWTGDNFAGWCFRDANLAIREAVTSLDPVARKAAYVRQQKLWTQELPALPLFQRLGLALVAPGVAGVRPDPLAPITWNVAEWRRAAR